MKSKAEHMIVINDERVDAFKYVKELLENRAHRAHRVAVIRGLLNIYFLQESDEKVGGYTNTINGVGFNKADAEILGSIAEYFIKHGYMTIRQYCLVERKIKKYWKQLGNIALGNIYVDIAHWVPDTHYQKWTV